MEISGCDGASTTEATTSKSESDVKIGWEVVVAVKGVSWWRSAVKDEESVEVGKCSDGFNELRLGRLVKIDNPRGVELYPVVVRVVGDRGCEVVEVPEPIEKDSLLVNRDWIGKIQEETFQSPALFF